LARVLISVTVPEASIGCTTRWEEIRFDIEEDIRFHVAIADASYNREICRIPANI
jgi:hypothetical protein